jgi:hypothetical protein
VSFAQARRASLSLPELLSTTHRRLILTIAAEVLQTVVSVRALAKLRKRKTRLATRTRLRVVFIHCERYLSLVSS